MLYFYLKYTKMRLVAAGGAYGAPQTHSWVKGGGRKREEGKRKDPQCLKCVDAPDLDP